MSKWAVIYSSVTGNTKRIAEAIAEQAEADIFRVQDAPKDVSGYDVVALGYWLRLGQPDPLMLQYLPKVHGTRVLFFQTHGTAPTSEHAITSFARAGYVLGGGNEVLGTFGCRGKINPAMKKKREKSARTDPNDPHTGPQSEARWKLASTHPDAADIEAAKEFVENMKHKIATRERYLAAKAAKMKAAAEAAASRKAES